MASHRVHIADATTGIKLRGVSVDQAGASLILTDFTHTQSSAVDTSGIIHRVDVALQIGLGGGVGRPRVGGAGGCGGLLLCESWNRRLCEGRGSESPPSTLHLAQRTHHLL